MNAEICGGGSGGRLGQVEKGQEHRVNKLVSQQDQTGALAGFLAMHGKKKVFRRHEASRSS